jgi:endonuclease-3
MPAKPSQKFLRRKARVDAILPILKRTYADAKCRLDFQTPFQYIVTRDLFKKYPTPRQMAKVSQEELERDIQSTGFYRNKAKSLRAMSAALVEKHGGEVPQSMEALTELAGVGRKTANVVLGNAFNQNVGVVVDTHVTRLSNRLGLTDHKTDAVKIEQDLMPLVPQEDWALWSHLMIHHGRAVCTARNPACERCPLLEHCPTGPKVLAERGE